MSQFRYIDFGAAGNSDQLVRGMIANITDSTVLEGGSISPAASTSLTPGIVLDSFSVVFEDGYVIGEDASVTVAIPNPSVSHVYTIIYEHVDEGMLFGTSAEIKLLEDLLLTTYTDSVVLGWLIYDGSGSQPTRSMIWESPRGIYSSASNCGYRDIILPPASSLVLDSSSTAIRAGSDGIMMDQQIVSGSLFGPMAPDSYVADIAANFTTYKAEIYNLASVTGEVFRMEVSGSSFLSFTEEVTANNGNFPNIAVGISAVELASGLNANFVHCSATVVTVSGDTYVKVSTTAAGSSAVMVTTGTTSSAYLAALGVLGGVTYTGWEQVDPFYSVYTAYSGINYTFTNTTQFNLKTIPKMYEWRFTVNNDSTSPVFTINKVYVSVNGVMYSGSDLQLMEVVNQTSPSSTTLGYKIRFLNSTFFEDYLGGVITIHIEASLDATSEEKLLVHYYNALYEVAYPQNSCTYYEALNCGVVGGTPTLHSVT